MGVGLILSAWGLFLLTGQLYAGIESQQIVHRAQWLSLLLFLLWPDVSYTIFFWLSAADPFAYASLIFGAFFGLRRQYFLAIAVTTFGVLSREVVLVLIPFLFLMNSTRKTDIDDQDISWSRLLIYSAIPLAVWFIVLGLIDAGPAITVGEDTLNVLDRFLAVRQIRAGGKLLSWSWLWKSFFVVGILWLRGFSERFCPRTLLWFFVTFLLVFIAGDTVRMMLYAIPVIIPIASMGLSDIANEKWRLSVIGVVLAFHAMNGAMWLAH
jgi:hypothetical protein